MTISTNAKGKSPVDSLTHHWLSVWRNSLDYEWAPISKDGLISGTLETHSVFPGLNLSGLDRNTENGGTSPSETFFRVNPLCLPTTPRSVPCVIIWCCDTKAVYNCYLRSRATFSGFAAYVASSIHTVPAGPLPFHYSLTAWFVKHAGLIFFCITIPIRTNWGRGNWVCLSVPADKSIFGYECSFIVQRISPNR